MKKFAEMFINMCIAIVITLIIQRTLFHEMKVGFFRDVVGGTTLVLVYLVLNFKSLKKGSAKD